ncbi:MAG: LOG family protein [Akkermansiaceae bacterium]
MNCQIVRELDTLEIFHRQNGNLNCCVVQGLDLREVDFNLSQVTCEGAIFLGCRFASDVLIRDLQDHGALVFPEFKGLPYHPYRGELYTREELMEGWTAEKNESVDKLIYEHFVAKGKKNPDIVEALAERLHDHAVDDAMTDLLEGRVEKDGRKKVVAIMGGHGTSRADQWFRVVAHLAWRLTREGYFIASGGGPGMMEAANLGAYLADLEIDELDRVLDGLAEAPVFTSEGYLEVAQRVIDQYPTGHSSLAVPTWFYGHEPTNLFSVHVAKYFSNSIREDGLLAIAEHGIIFSPGSAGTTQEIFQDATQNHYATFETISPMVFLSKERYTEQTHIWQTIKELAKGRHYDDFLCLSDEVDEIVEFIKAHPPVASDGRKAVES